ncbi:hypothetical protein BUE80_DR002663 [Diplocarpon rosae]|nr:hypothetical protein BUE80_DR002663 [Diplocarpon rosae]
MSAPLHPNPQFAVSRRALPGRAALVGRRAFAARPVAPPVSPGRLHRPRLSRDTATDDPGVEDQAAVRADSPKPRRTARPYHAAELVDRASIEAAIEEIILRAKDVFGLSESTHVQIPDGPGFVAFAGTFTGNFPGDVATKADERVLQESRTLTKEELAVFALAEKTVASQIAAATRPDAPVSAAIFFAVDPNAPFSTRARPGPAVDESIRATKVSCHDVPPFAFKELPNEIRSMIYPLCGNLALRHDGQAPALVLALARDSLLGAEVKTLYKEINCRIGVDNEAEFGQKKLKELLVFRNVYLQWGLAGGEEHSDRLLSLTAHKIQLMNNFRSLTMDFSTSEPSNLSLIQQISRASSGVDHLAIRLHAAAASRARPHTRASPQARMHLLNMANEWIKVPARLSTVGPADAVEDWFWARDDGAALDIALPCRRQVVTPSVAGNMTMADRIQGRSALMQWRA